MKINVNKDEFESLVQDVATSPESAESRNAINYMAFSAMNEDESEENRLVMLAALEVTKRMVDKAYAKVQAVLEFEEENKD